MFLQQAQDRGFRLARPRDAGRLVALRDDLAAWLVGCGIRQWRPGEFPHDRMAAWVRAGWVHVLDRRHEIAAAVAVLWEDPEIWGTSDDQAGYVHLLMVDRAWAGSGLGDAALGYAEEWIRAHDRDLARLDVVATNRALQGWYRWRGYDPVGVKRFERADLFDTVLFEKRLT